MPDLAICRAAVDAVLSGKTEWNNKIEWIILRPNTDEIDGIHSKKQF
jgi:hypothetical protein